MKKLIILIILILVIGGGIYLNTSEGETIKEKLSIEKPPIEKEPQGIIIKEIVSGENK